MRKTHIFYKPIALCILFCMLPTLLSACSMRKSTYALSVCIESNLYSKMRQVFDQYSEMYPNVTVTYDILPNLLVETADLDGSRLTYDLNGVSYDSNLRQQMMERLYSEVMSGSGPDLFVLNTGASYESFFQDTEKAMQNGVFCDLLPLFREVGITEEDFIEPVIDAGKVGGKQYVIPLDFQLLTIVTSAASRAAIGDSAFSDTESMLSCIRSLCESTDFINKLVFDNYGSNNFMDISSYYLSEMPLVDFDIQRIQVDTPLTRDVLETGKAIYDKICGRTPYKDFLGRIGFKAWDDYIKSEDYFMLSSLFVGICQETELIDYTGNTPYIDVFPSENGGVCAIINSYAGIRANSENKLNAINMIELMLSPEVQSSPLEYDTGTHFNGWSIQKDVVGTRIAGLIRPRAPINCIDFDWKMMGATDEENFKGMAPVNIQKIVELESKIVMARFPTPKAVRVIISRYYSGEISLDDAISDMQEYWEWTAFE